MSSDVDILDPAPILVDRVYEQLMLAITAGRLAPGKRIRQADLATQFGVSRQPISHALQLLKRQGLVQEVGRKGLEITPVDPDRVRNLYQVRAALDSLAARLAAERVRGGKCFPQDWSVLEGVVEKGCRLAPRTSIAELVVLDIEFHKEIYRLSGNPSIMDTLEPQLPHLMRSMHVVYEARTFRVRAWSEHAAIAQALIAGDAAAAAEGALRHAESAGEETGRRLRAG